MKNYKASLKSEIKDWLKALIEVMSYVALLILLFAVILLLAYWLLPLLTEKSVEAGIYIGSKL